MVGVGAAALLAVFFLVRGTGGSGPSTSSKGWTAASVAAFVDECAQNGARSKCLCIVDELKETMLYVEYEQFKAAGASGQPPSLPTATAIGVAGAHCQNR